MRMHRIATATLAVALAVAAAACSKKTASPDSPLAYIPADSPYVFAMVEPLPTNVTDAWAESFAPLGAFYEEMLKSTAANISKEGENALGAKIATAVAAELQGKMSIAGLATIGVKPFTMSAVYGIGVVPVARIELSDPAAFAAFIDRIEARVGEKLPRGKAGELSFYRMGVDEDKLAGIMAIQGKHLVLTLAPREASDTLLRQLLGVDPPEQAYTPDQLVAFNKERGYLPYGSGYIDNVRLMQVLTERRTGLEKEFLAALDVKDDTISPACKTEFAEIAARMPRLSFGYTELEPKRMDIRATLETDAALAAELKTLTAPVPGLGAEGTGMFSFGWGADLAKFAQFIEAHGAAVEAKPYTCEALLELNAGWADTREKVGNPMLFAMASAFKGALASMTRFEMTPGAPPVVSGKLVIASDNPKALLQLAGNAMPALNTLPVKAGADPVPLPAGVLPPTVPPSHVAMSDKALGIAMGEGEETGLVAYINAPPAAEPPFFFASYTGEFFKSMGGFSQTMLAMESDDEKRAEAQRSMQLMQDLYGKALKRIDVSLVFTDRGAEFRETVTLN
jgi:hypothetical protein